MLIECSECKNQVSGEATKCPKCGHALPAGTRKNMMLVACGFIVVGLFGPRMFPSTSLTHASSDNAKWLILVFLGVALLLCARFSKNIGNQKDR